MLILNQLGNKVVNLDAMESVEIGYELGKSYSIKAVGYRDNNEYDNGQPITSMDARSVVRLGEYESSLTAEAVLTSMYHAYAQEARCFKMPKDGEIDA